jgi:molecular chaperone GrpE
MKKAEPEIENTEAGEPAGSQNAAVAPEQLEELKARAAKADEHWDRLLRTTADFENFKKRAIREKQDAIRFANEGLIEKLVPILDNFDMALAAAQASDGDAAQSLQAGIALIHQQLKQTLADAGLEEINAAGQKFDPNWHEAISQVETADTPEGQVVQQARKGYKLRDRLLRPASVVVSKTPAA